MYAYVDETGNTGKNLFDKNQPLFVTAALITKEDFDAKYQSQIMSIARSVGCSFLHANELSNDKIETVSEALRRVLVACGGKFSISSVDKYYLATTKLVDTLFDSYENKAVPWHVYNFRPLRLLLVYKIAYILTEETAVKFWNSLLEKKEDKAYEEFVAAISELRELVVAIPDERSRTIIYDAIDWAIKHPREIYLHTNAKTIREGHLPNMVVFPNLLRGIDQILQETGLSVKKITHDRQHQFERILKEWHGLLSNAAPDVISWPGEEDVPVQCVESSRFVIASSEESVGIQSIDLVLWLFKRFLDGKPLGKHSRHILEYVFENSYHNSLSFEIVGQWLEGFMEELFSKPLKKEDVDRARRMLKVAEKKRQLNVAEFDRQKLDGAEKSDFD